MSDSKAQKSINVQIGHGADGNKCAVFRCPRCYRLQAAWVLPHDKCAYCGQQLDWKGKT
jgi:uncharacterized protein (DUF983 family)